mgnify:FL=1
MLANSTLLVGMLMSSLLAVDQTTAHMVQPEHQRALCARADTAVLEIASARTITLHLPAETLHQLHPHLLNRTPLQHLSQTLHLPLNQIPPLLHNQTQHRHLSQLQRQLLNQIPRLLLSQTLQLDTLRARSACGTLSVPTPDVVQVLHV